MYVRELKEIVKDCDDMAIVRVSGEDVGTIFADRNQGFISLDYSEPSEFLEWDHEHQRPDLYYFVSLLRDRSEDENNVARFKVALGGDLILLCGSEKFKGF